MITLGVNAPPLGWHDPSAALIGHSGEVLALVEEERVSRRKHGLHLYPTNAVAECLNIAGYSGSDIDVVCVGWDLPRQWPRTDRDALNPPLPGRLWAFDDWKTYIRLCLGDIGADRSDLLFVPHHQAHAASSFYASGFDSAAILVVDGNGDDEAISIFEGRRGQSLIRRHKLPYSHSLGCMYDAASDWLGLSFLEAGKTMGLAAYGRGQPTRLDMFERTSDGIRPPFELPSNAENEAIIRNWHSHFDSAGFTKLDVGRDKLAQSSEAIELAWAVQLNLERSIDHLAKVSRRITGEERLCLAGGVALNCSANGQLRGPVYVPPVPHDAGVALGAAWSVNPPKANEILSPYLGRQLVQEDVDQKIYHLNVTETTFDPGSVADRLGRGQTGAIVAGRSEAGPRALCHRSIISLAPDTDARDRLNTMKGRELWRPLSPVAREDDCSRYWVDNDLLSRYMLGAAKVTDLCKSNAPGVVHIDGSARPQKISDETEPVHRILCALDEAGATPILINTSFNGRGEPIVDDAASAFAAFEKIGLDFLVLDGDRMVVRNE